MNATDRKTLVEMHSDLTSQLEDLMAIRDRLDEDAAEERRVAAHALDGLSDARFYVDRVLVLTRGFYPATDAA
jgi:hypothetical protein